MTKKGFEVVILALAEQRKSLASREVRIKSTRQKVGGPNLGVVEAPEVISQSPTEKGAYSNDLI